MADLIDRAALIKQINLTQSRTSLGEVCARDINGLEICTLIKEAPTVDAVEVVRCKDCNHWEEIKHGYGWCCAATPNHALTKNDDYCSYGERRET